METVSRRDTGGLKSVYAEDYTKWIQKHREQNADTAKNI
jgi:hypothetical protein